MVPIFFKTSHRLSLASEREVTAWVHETIAETARQSCGHCCRRQSAVLRAVPVRAGTAILGDNALRTWDTLLAFIRATTTSSGLAVQAAFQLGDYPIGQ